MNCACCSSTFNDRGPEDQWEGRLAAYCEDCALQRCDAYPGEHPKSLPPRTGESITIYPLPGEEIHRWPGELY